MTLVTASPRPGNKPSKKSRPKRRLVPGTLNWSSIMRAMKRTWASRCSWVSPLL